MTAPTRPLPRVNEDSEPYWRSAKKHALRIQKCATCDRHRFYPSLACHFCGSWDVDWVTIGGEGCIYSYTVVHRAGVGPFAERMPYTIVLVELDEGPVMMANLLDESGSDVDADHTATARGIGDRVRVAYEDVTDEVTLPVFVPVVSG